ncbi:cephalosporin hydroxylase family protein [Pseudomonadales bacterium]|nr:cephalosporin hydroxylase family protein [Pseudomonadales bacterium]
MEQIKIFNKEKNERIASYAEGSKGIELGKQFNIESCKNGYTYNFSWMGIPIIQYPQDIVMMQELMFELKPDLIIETGIAHGGSLVFYASMFELLGKGHVVGVDIEVREHNRQAIENHPMFKRITMIEGSSVDQSTVDEVKKHIGDAKTIMVCLDSKHTHQHVLEELKAYSQFVTADSYLVVFDTTVETFDKEIVDEMEKDYRFSPWGKGSNPHSAITEFMSENNEFEIQEQWHKKTMITNCWDGVLKKVR